MVIYVKKYPFCIEELRGLTILEAERAFQLSPDPPKVETLNDYIVMAVRGDENGAHSQFPLARGISEY